MSLYRGKRNSDKHVSKKLLSTRNDQEKLRVAKRKFDLPSEPIVFKDTKSPLTPIKCCNHNLPAWSYCSSLSSSDMQLSCELVCNEQSNLSSISNHYCKGLLRDLFAQLEKATAQMRLSTCFIMRFSC